MLLHDVMLDMELYHKCPERYTKIKNYLIKRRDRVYKKFMGKYIKEPLPLYEELMISIYCTQDKIINLTELKVPDIIIQNVQENFENLIQQLNNSKYVVTKKEKDYYIAYHNKRQQFFNNNIHDTEYNFDEDYDYKVKYLKKLEDRIYNKSNQNRKLKR